MNPQRFNEFTGDVKGKKLTNLRPTERKQVSIHQHEADRLNAVSHKTKKYYELADDQPSDTKSFEEMNVSDIQKLKSPEAQELAKGQGAEGELTGKDAKEFLTKIKNDK